MFYSEIHQTLEVKRVGNGILLSVYLPYGGGSDDTDEQNSAPAESMACWEHKDVLQEERVQLC